MDPLKVTPPPETKLHFLDYWRIIRIRKTVILAVFLLVVITATLVTFMLPQYYASTAQIRVERDQTDIASMMPSQSMFAGGYDPYFMQTELAVIKSDDLLSNVVWRLNLNAEWGKKYGGGDPLSTRQSINILKGELDVSPVRMTSLINITDYSQDRNEAARISEAIALEYQQHRTEQRNELSAGGIKTLWDQYTNMTTQITEQQTRVDDLRQKYKISDVLANESAPTPLMSAENLRKLKELEIESEFDYVQKQALLDQLSKLPEQKLVQTIETTSQDANLTTLLDQKDLVDQKLVVASRALGKKNPDLADTEAQLLDLNNKIQDRVNGILKGLKTKVEAIKTGLDELKKDVENARTEDIQMAQKTRPYWDAKRRLDTLNNFRRVLEYRIASEQVDKALPKTTMVEIIEHAQPGLAPVKPDKTLNIALGIIIGLVVGVGLAFFIEYLDTSVKTIDDVERALQAPVLGVIPQNVGLMIDEGIESPHAEAYRVLRTNLLFSRKDDKLNTVAVVSAGAGEGKSTTVFNLAAVFAQGGQRVIVVDSDLRRPTLHKMLRVSNSIGLTNFLLKQNTLEEVIQTTNVPTMDFMASGKLPSSSLGILSSVQMRDLITELKQRYDFVFFDSPPIMGVSDASILASAVDMALQVIQYRRYPQPMNIRAKQLIEKVGGNLVGIVLNNINMSQDESYYYYSGYYHDYYYSHRDETPEPAAPKGTEAPASEKTKLEIKQKY